MIVAAFDLATVTGCCDGPVGGAARLWSWHLDDAGSERGARFHALFDFTLRYLEQEKPDRVIYEAPMPLGVIGEKGRNRIQMSEANIAFLRGLPAVLELACFRRGKPCVAYGVQDARSSVLGWRTNRVKGIKAIHSRAGQIKVRAETTKERVLREVTMLLGIDAQNDNEADAYVMWAYACNLVDPRLAVASTPLFREAR